MSASSTIAAIATAPGPCAVAVVRLSGPEARRTARRLLRSRAARLLDAGRLRIYASFHDPVTGEPVDRGLVHVFPGPGSYTGEDVVELHGHGGVVAPQRVLAAVLAAGAAPAEPGEFTRRALLNGKLDLLQAEAVLDMIEARGEALHRQAVYQLAGSLSRRVAGLRDSLLEAMALFELQIDFPEEDVEIPADVGTRVRGVREQVRALAATYAAGGVLRHGLRVVIAGRPNVGKSALFNCLLGEERAIVSRHPGTTRDAIEAEMAADGIVLRLVDTAGLHEARGEVEAIGVELSRRQLEGAQIVLAVVEATREPSSEEIELLADLSGRPHVIALSKCDLLTGEESDGVRAQLHKLLGVDIGTWRGKDIEVVATSAMTGAGRSELIASLLRHGTTDVKFRQDSPAITRLRHKVLLESCLDPLDNAIRELEAASPAAEKVASDLHDAAHALSGLLGRVTPDDVLDRIFSSFCIGK